MIVIDQSTKANPYKLYARLRDQSPVTKVLYGASRTPVWLVTRYDDVVTVLKDPRFSNDRRKSPLPISFRSRFINSMFAPLVGNMLYRDQPDHTRLRGLVHQAFTPQRVASLRSRMEELTHALAEGAKRQWPWDLVSQFALPLPAIIIAEMLGVPSEDRERFRNWSNALLLSSATSWKGMVSNFPRFLKFSRYIRNLVRERRQNPDDDLVSALVLAEEAGETLHEDELVAMIFLLLIGGYETTMNLIGSGVLSLIENPDELETLRAYPKLIPLAVEEFARYYSPLDYASVRYALRAVELSGVTIPRGEAVVAAIGSANRDDRQFPRPDMLDVARQPNRHLGFGMGIHYCLGAPLARLEAQVAFRTLLEKFSGFELAIPRHHVKWRQSTLLRGVESLPLRLVVSRRALKSSA